MKIYLYKDRSDFCAQIGRKAPDALGSVRQEIWKEDNWHYLRQGWYKLFLILDGERLLYAGAIKDTYEKRSVRSWDKPILEMGAYLAASHDVPYKEGGFTIEYQFYRWKSFPHKFSKSDALKALIACGKEQTQSVKDDDDDSYKPGKNVINV